MKRTRGIPPAIPKALYGLMLVFGVILYIGWTAVFLLPQGRLFDVGLFSLCIPLILMGATGYVLYGEQEMRRR
ncbi:MAG TPA: hypothetical protein EYP43_02715 [Thermoplasmata archaeon]|nr:hypothetical protein [Thermoplasmata archaeon]